MPTIDLTETSDWNPEARSAGSHALDASKQPDAGNEIAAIESMDATRVDSHQNSTNHQTSEIDSDFELSVQQASKKTTADASIPPVDQNIGRMFNAKMDGKIQKLRLISLIGIGGMGKVYEAISLSESQSERYAVKIAKRTKDSAKVIARFNLESSVLQKLNHPNIVQFKADGSFEKGIQFIAMELIDGPNIVEFAQQQKLTIKEKITLFGKVCDAVSYCHDQGYLHRDIKPANVLVETSTREPILIDFGVVKLRDAMQTSNSESAIKDCNGTSTNGQLVGTIQYMSPEQAQRNESAIDPRTDVYSLGVLLHEMLTGTPPISREELRQHSLESIVAKIADEKDPTLIDLKTTLGESKGLEESELLGKVSPILSAAISADLDDRYSSVADFKDELLAATNNRGLDSVKVTRKSVANTQRPIRQSRTDRSCNVSNFLQDNLWKAISLCLIIALFVSIQANRPSSNAETAKDSNFEGRSLFDSGFETQFCNDEAIDELKEMDSLPPAAPRFFHDHQMVEESLYVIEKVGCEKEQQVELQQVVDVRKLQEKKLLPGKNKLRWMIKPAPRQYFAGTNKIEKDVQKQTIQRFNLVIQNMDNRPMTQVKKLIERIPHNTLHKCMFRMDGEVQDMTAHLEY